MKIQPHDDKAFTLIELSIVLVIIGLIVGGILVGRDLISAAGIRAQIAQIEDFKTATYTFKAKYNNLPGDLPSADADSFGFYRSTSPNDTGCSDYYSSKCGNGNGVIGDNMAAVESGERHLFWLDLSVAKLIKNTVTTYDYNVTSAAVYNYLPPAKLENSYVYVWSGGTSGSDGKNYLGVHGIGTYCNFGFGHGTDCQSFHNMPVADAYKIDQKMDDDFPQSGNVLAMYVGYDGQTQHCGSGGNTQGMWVGISTYYCLGDPTTNAELGDSTTCYDNSNTAGQPQRYSMGQNNGTGRNCALSFKF